MASMEVALRWFEIYWATCLLGKRVPAPLFDELSGFAAASGRFIEGRLSTHSSSGNHLILEAVGLHWIGIALAPSLEGRRWVDLARAILWREIPRQINDDGSSVEQSFWYLGFVVDALLHYLLLEDRAVVPENVIARVRKALDFIDGLIQGDGTFPDFGDRDDGVVFRDGSDYGQTHFPGLLAAGRALLRDPPSRFAKRLGRHRQQFWGLASQSDANDDSLGTTCSVVPEPRVATYSQGGMTLLHWGKLRALFRHAPLGLPPMYGHGHADALSVLLWWGSSPLIIDLGSGQYNGDQSVRNYFRSTIAHNTVELAGESQARILGPFLWEKTYSTVLEGSGQEPEPWAAASHDGYRRIAALVHRREVRLTSGSDVQIVDSFHGTGQERSRTAFHFPRGSEVDISGPSAQVNVGGVKLTFRFPQDHWLEVYEGSASPFLGWRSTIYGQWEPTPALLAVGEAKGGTEGRITITIAEG
jgi:hypothetical protein